MGLDLVTFPTLRHLKESLGPWPLAAQTLEVFWAVSGCRPSLWRERQELGRLWLREQSPGPLSGCRGGCVPSQMLMAVGGASTGRARPLEAAPTVLGGWGGRPGTCLGVGASPGHGTECQGKAGGQAHKIRKNLAAVMWNFPHSRVTQ